MLQGLPLPGRVRPTAREVYRSQVGEKVDWFIPRRTAERGLDQPGTIVCPRCHAISTQKRWFLDEGRYEQLRQLPTTRLLLCPGCRRIERQIYEGDVRLRSPLLLPNKIQALHLIYHEEDKARQTNPFSRLAVVEDLGSEIRILTTTCWLAERIGRAFQKSFKGTLIRQRLPGERFVRVRWSRPCKDERQSGPTAPTNLCDKGATMRVDLTGKNVALSDDLETYAARKFQHLARYHAKLDRVEVELTREATRDVQNHYVCQANVIGSGSLILRGEVRAADPCVAIDTLVDQLAARFEQQHAFVESERRPNVHGHLPPTPEEAFDQPSTLDRILTDFGVDDRTIARLKASGVLTPEQLRATVEDGRLAALLGPGDRQHLRELERVVEQLRR